jgi:hypothetical protein
MLGTSPEEQVMLMNTAAPPDYVRPADPKKIAKYQDLAESMAASAAEITAILEGVDGFRPLFEDLRDWRATAIKLFASRSFGPWQDSNLSFARLRGLMVGYGQLRSQATQLWVQMTPDERHNLQRPEAY